jgi:transcriptional regulator with XRE-family HTH domain
MSTCELNHQAISAQFRAKGWTLRQAGQRLGVSHHHVGCVLRGQRQSIRLLKRIASLPAKPIRKGARS